MQYFPFANYSIAYHKAADGCQDHAVEAEDSSGFAFVICIYAWQGGIHSCCNCLCSCLLQKGLNEDRESQEDLCISFQEA